jgi:hypothetical protein
VVEADGCFHDLGSSRERARDVWLRAAGLLTLRFSNDDILDRSEAVVARIVSALRERLPRHDELMLTIELQSPSPLAPLPEGEGNSTIGASPLSPRERGRGRG